MSTIMRKSDKNHSLFSGYEPIEDTYDEYYYKHQEIRPAIDHIVSVINKFSLKKLSEYDALIKQVFIERGITFKISSENGLEDRTFPFDLIPRIITALEWKKIENGILQRVKALNLFLDDIYGEQQIIKDKQIPKSLITSCKDFISPLRGVSSPGGARINIAGCDLIRAQDGEFYVLEDNLRVPSGVSYLLENRKIMKEFLPEWMTFLKIHDVDMYPKKLKSALQSLSIAEDPLIVLLTPGPYNSAYFEHCYLARRMGCPLVENHEIFVQNKKVFWNSKEGVKRIDVIYKRTDDQFLDNTFFRKDSLLGIRGLVDSYASGNVALANALGNGVADDKAIYCFVPKMIEYYLNENSILPQIKTYIAANLDDKAYILENLHELVIKVVNQSGGHGMLIGPQSTKEQQNEFYKKITASPRDYIAQPLINLSSMPALSGTELYPHRIDLRIFAISGCNQAWVLPGALTRVALKKGSYVVNSCQGGGSKDTWVLK